MGPPTSHCVDFGPRESIAQLERPSTRAGCVILPGMLTSTASMIVAVARQSRCMVNRMRVSTKAAADDG